MFAHIRRLACIMVALVATLSFATAAHAEVPAIKAGDVQLGEFDTGLYGTVVELAWPKLSRADYKACNRKSNRKQVEGGQVAVRTYLGHRAWARLEDSWIEICRVNGKSIVVGLEDGNAEYGGGLWRKKGPTIRGAVTAIDNFDTFKVSLAPTAEVEIIGTCYSGHTFRQIVGVKPSMDLRGYEVADLQGSSSLANQYAQRFLEESAAKMAVANFRGAWVCPDGMAPPSLVYPKPDLSCVFPEAWIVPQTPVYEYRPTGSIWCDVVSREDDPVKDVRVTEGLETSRFESSSYSYLAKGACKPAATKQCFEALYDVTTPGTYHFEVTATTVSGQQDTYRGSARVYEGYPSGGNK